MCGISKIFHVLGSTNHPGLREAGQIAINDLDYGAAIAINSMVKAAINVKMEPDDAGCAEAGHLEMDWGKSGFVELRFFGTAR